MKTLLLSPHLDDAVLSAGQFLANQPGCHCLTVFAGIPPRGKNDVTPYDSKTGFKSSHLAMEARRFEDRDAMARLQCDPFYFDSYLDHQYRNGTDPDVHHLARTIADFVREGEYERVISCLGLLHPDHILLGDAVVEASKSFDAPLYLWEDLPNRVLYPEEVPKHLAHVQAQGFKTTLEAPGGAGPMADKIRALLCYRSQLGTGDLDFNLLLVPERFWKLRKDGDEEV